MAGALAAHAGAFGGGNVHPLQSGAAKLPTAFGGLAASTDEGTPPLPALTTVSGPFGLAADPLCAPVLEPSPEESPFVLLGPAKPGTLELPQPSVTITNASTPAQSNMFCNSGNTSFAGRA
jgi:hypothetical protein